MGKLAFEGQVVWITGASSGIGRYLALEFARQGAEVAISARRTDRLEALVGELESLGRRALAVACDVTDEAQVEAAVGKVAAHFGRLDVAIANAGFGVNGPVERLSADDWRRQFDTNVVGAAMTGRYALPELRKTKGRLVLVGSAAAFVVAPGTAAYSASKAALRVMGMTLRTELYGSGVSCSTLHPGFVESEIGQVDNRGNFSAERKDRRPQGLMWTTDRAARVMVRAIEKRRGDFVFTGHGKFGAFVGQHFPSLAVWLVSRFGGGRGFRSPAHN